ncbi:MAG: 2-phosphosulfolactate phosphatase [Pirellulales bacterium]
MPDRQINVHSLPQKIAEQDLAGSTVVVIDVLRASTMICQALASGAREVVPLIEVDDAVAAAAKANRKEVILGGERGGRRIDGFDLGNSPSEYTPATVRDRRVLITTTNGTRALQHARLARRVLIGAFVNLSAVAASVKDEPRVDILCAGTDGRETREDVLAAGAIVTRLRESGACSLQLNHAAEQSRREWGHVLEKADVAGRSLSEQLASEFRDSPGGRNLIEIGLDDDLIDCAQIDRLNVVPELVVRAWRITLAPAEKPLR